MSVGWIVFRIRVRKGWAHDLNDRPFSQIFPSRTSLNWPNSGNSNFFDRRALLLGRHPLRSRDPRLLARIVLGRAHSPLIQMIVIPSSRRTPRPRLPVFNRGIALFFWSPRFLASGRLHFLLTRLRSAPLSLSFFSSSLAPSHARFSSRAQIFSPYYQTESPSCTARRCQVVHQTTIYHSIIFKSDIKIIH